MSGVREGSGAEPLRDADLVWDPLETSSPDLPEEIWHHIHSLVPMREAARAACVSRSFHRSWRCHPTLIFTKETMCPEESLRKWRHQELIPPFFLRLCSTTKSFSEDESGRSEYNNNIDRILANHRGAGVKEFVLQFHGPCTTESYNRLNRWLQIAVTPVLEELHLSLLSGKEEYEFPCSLLSDRSGNAIQYLSLRNCVLRPTVNLGLRCLTELELYEVRITGDELGHILSGSFALEYLVLKYCNDIIRFEIPCQLKRLSFLEVYQCSRLEVVENKAPNMSSFEFTGNEIQLSLGKSFQVKKICLTQSRLINYAIDKLASSVPNLETLTLYSRDEIGNAPMVPNKFLHLKVLSIHIRNWRLDQDYDFLSLVSFLDACPSLETFFLSVFEESKYDSIVGDPSTLRQMPECHHERLKDVKITGFCARKSLVELTRHILESATSLKCLILDTIHINYRCSGNESDKCHTLVRTDMNKVRESVMAIKTYIEGKVPSTAQLHVLEPCSRCHDW